MIEEKEWYRPKMYNSIVTYKDHYEENIMYFCCLKKIDDSTFAWKGGFNGQRMETVAREKESTLFLILDKEDCQELGVDIGSSLLYHENTETFTVVSEDHLKSAINL